MSGNYKNALERFESARRFYLSECINTEIAADLREKHSRNAEYSLWFMSICQLAMNNLPQAEIAFQRYTRSIGSSDAMRKGLYKQLVSYPPPRLMSMLALGPHLSGTLDGSGAKNDAEVFRRVGDYLKTAGKKKLAQECFKRADQLAGKQ